jgi:flagellar biosynthesis protein FlhG
VKSEADGAGLFLRFADVVQQFLSVRIQYKGSIPYDVNLKISNQHQRLILRQDPKAISTSAIKVICAEIESQNKTNSSQSPNVKGLDTLFRPVSGHA